MFKYSPFKLIIMKNTTITRKKFFTDSSKLVIGGVAGIAGVNLLVNKQLHAENKETHAAQWPFPYVALDPEEARLNAHLLYWNDKDCCCGVFGGISQLLEKAIGSPWTNIPIEIMLFGRGGGAGWGSLCGALNGASAIISLVTSKADSEPLINELWGWCTTESLPSTAANSKTYLVQKYVGNLVSNISGSVLCHPSVSLWCIAANKKITDVERKERCGRLSGDVAAKTVQLLNEYFNHSFTSTFHDSQTVASCMDCHSKNTKTHMECVSCHTTAHHQSTPISGFTFGSSYILNEAYPNPFRASTNIQFTIPGREKVRLEIYDIKGSLVNSLIDSDFMEAGSYIETWNGTNNLGETMKSGIYLAKFTTANYMKTIKISYTK